MIAASFVTLMFWLFVIFAACTVMLLVGEWHENRERRRRRERLRERRRQLDNLEAKPWDRRAA